MGMCEGDGARRGFRRAHQDHVQNNIGFLGEEEVNKWLSVSVDGNSSKTIEPKREKSVDFVVVVVVAEIFKF